MLDISKEEILEQLNIYNKLTDDTLKRWDQIVPDKIPVVNYRMGLHTQSIAVYNLMLGNKSEAIEWLEKSAEYYHMSGSEGFGFKDGSTLMYLHALGVAILSQNQNLIKTYSEEASKLKYIRGDTPPPLFFHYVLSLSNVFLERDREAIEHIEKLEEIEPNNYAKLKYYHGMAKSLKGIVKNDFQTLVEGIDEILKRHKKLIPSLGKKSDDALVCIPATDILILARGRKIEFKPEDFNEKLRHYIPWNLFE